MVFSWWPSIQWWRNLNSLYIRALPSPKTLESLVSRQQSGKERVCGDCTRLHERFLMQWNGSSIHYLQPRPIGQTSVTCTLICKGGWEMSTIHVPRQQRKLVWWRHISLYPSFKEKYLHLSHLCISCALHTIETQKSLMNFVDCEGVKFLSHVPKIESYQTSLWSLKEWVVILGLDGSLLIFEF